MAKLRAHRLNIWRMKADILEDDIIREDIPGLQTIKTSIGDTDAKLYVKQTPQRTAAWHGFLTSATSMPLKVLETQSASAMILVRADDRFYAVAFGHSRSWINKSAIERRFGMMVTLNAVDEKSLKSVDKEEFETLQRKTRTQTSTETEFDQFGVDVQRDLLRSVTGRPEDKELADHLVGADNLIATVRFEPGKLVAKLSEFGQISEETKYKDKGFDWIDHFGRVTDPVLVEQLDQKLMASIKEGALEKAFLAAPTPLDYQVHGGFLLSGERAKSAEKRADLRIADWIEHLGVDNIDLNKLKTDHIRRFGVSDEVPEDRFSAYEAMIFEVQEGDYLYILTGEEWYQIDHDHVKEVETELKTIPICDIALSDAQPGEVEGLYNARVCAASAGTFDLLDAKPVMYGGGRSKVEVCDILTDAGQFVHVKSKIKSATLSHLFTQGTASAQALRDSRFRCEARAKCAPTHAHFFDGNPDPANHEIVFAIITTTPGDIRDALPFLSKQSCVNAVGIIRGLGHPVCITRIAVN